MTDTVIGICTYHRPAMLARALEGVARLEPVEGGVAVLVVDNVAKGSARTVVETFRQTSGMEVIYRVEPEAGLVNARNRLLDEALKTGARFMAGFDDDATPEPDWLVKLMKARQDFDATGIAGPQINEHFDRRHLHEAHAHFTREGKFLPSFATSNYLIDLDFIRKHGIRFDPQFNLTGGEDSDFTKSMHAAGARLAWTNTAIVHEKTSADRLNMRARIKRAMAFGQNGFIIRRKHRRDKPWIYWLMSVAGKLIARTLAIAPSALKGREACTRQTLKAAEYLGRLVYLFGIRIYLYKKKGG